MPAQRRNKKVKRAQQAGSREWVCKVCGETYTTYFDMLEHGLETHVEPNGTPTFNFWFTGVDKPHKDPNDRTTPVLNDQFFSIWNLPSVMLTVDAQPESKPRMKSHQGRDYLVKMKEDGSILKGPRGHELYDIPNLPDRFGTTVENAYVQYKFMEIPDLKIKDIIDRMGIHIGESTLTQRLQRYRMGKDSHTDNGGVKNFFMRTPLEQSKDGSSRPNLAYLENLTAEQWDYNTVADVNNGIVTLPKPQDWDPSEIWNPRPLQVWRNGTPHHYPEALRNHWARLQAGKVEASSRGLDSWKDLTNVELGLSGREGVVKEKTAREKAKIAQRPPPARRPEIQYEGATLPGARRYFEYTRDQLREMIQQRGLPTKTRDNKTTLARILVEDDENRAVTDEPIPALPPVRGRNNKPAQALKTPDKRVNSESEPSRTPVQPVNRRRSQRASSGLARSNQPVAREYDSLSLGPPTIERHNTRPGSSDMSPEKHEAADVGETHLAALPDNGVTGDEESDDEEPSGIFQYGEYSNNIQPAANNADGTWGQEDDDLAALWAQQ